MHHLFKRKLGFFLLLLASQLNGLSIEEKEINYRYLDNLAIEAGTDKSSLAHNYTKVYAQYFDDYKDKPIKFLEIGIYFGNSVKLWENYFSEADLHFIDINRNQIEYNPLRAKYHFHNQADPKALQEFLSEAGGGFDIIIDDGGHRMVQQMVSFLVLFPALKNGGMYVIEDLHTSYWKTYGGNGTQESPLAGSGTTVHFLQSLVDDLNYSGAVTGSADASKNPPSLQIVLNEFQDKIEAIHFYKSLCIIIKKE